MKLKQCILNFGKGSWYPKGQQRVKKLFIEQGYTGDFMLYNNESQLGCKPHKQNPYAFKAYGFKKAYEQGYEVVIWVDCSIHLMKPYQEVLDNILKNKYLLMLNGWTSGEWCADTALKPLGITREESFTYPHIMACVMGFDLRDSTNLEFIQEYYDRASDGITFPGAWTNDKQQVSNHPKVLGHRHDQTAASVIAWRLGMRNFQEYLLYYQDAIDRGAYKIPETALFKNKGGAF